MVVLDGVVRVYREGDTKHRILHGVNASIAPGEQVVLLGRSGSGKSTLLNLIAGIDLPTAGAITIDGVRVDTLSERDRTLLRRRRIGFVFQFFNLIPTLTVAENLQLPLELAGDLDSAGRRVVVELLDEIGLESRADTYPDRLSGGEQQRVAIARALAHGPDLLLADEPTGNLDIETGEHVLRLLDRLVRQRGKTMITATHSREVAALADRVLQIRDGHLEELPVTTATPGAQPG